jgi:hypothetical protein
MTPAEYLDQVSKRLRADGVAVTTAAIGGSTAVVGYRAKFRLAWMATRLNLFVVAAETQSVTAEELEQFSEDALAYAIDRKGRLRGLQTGVATIPVLIGTIVEPAAAAYAQDQLIRRWSAFAWPTAVDLSAQVLYQHQGRVLVGGVYASWMRSQIGLALPDPRG